MHCVDGWLLRILPISAYQRGGRKLVVVYSGSSVCGEQCQKCHFLGQLILHGSMRCAAGCVCDVTGGDEARWCRVEMCCRVELCCKVEMVVQSRVVLQSRDGVAGRD